MSAQVEFLPQAISKRLVSARQSGTLVLTHLGLTSIPRATWDQDVAIDGDAAPWYNIVALTKLNVGNNDLTTLPDGISQLRNLVFMDISHNEFTTIPSAFSDLESLKVLDASSNKISGPVDALASLPSLAKLTISDNDFSILPEDLGRAQTLLSSVAANRCKLETLPTGLAHAPALKDLSFSGNFLSQLNAQLLEAFTALTSLDLSGNRLTGTLPDTLGNCTALVILNISFNALSALPPALGLCSALVELHAGRNMLQELPDELGLCDNLASLIVPDNKLRTLGAGVPTLEGLRLLDLSNNDLKSLPTDLGRLAALRAVLLTGNPLKSIPRAVRDGPVSRLLQYLRDKDPDEGPPDEDTAARNAEDLASQAAQHLAVSAAAESHARESGADDGIPRRSAPSGKDLDLSGKGLRDLPDDVWEAASVLGALKLSKNKLTTLDSAQLTACESLTALDVSNNSLTAWPLPLQPHCLRHLRTVNVAFNRSLPALPPRAFDACMQSLTEVTLSGCATAAQDVSSLANCLNLRGLHLDQCSLSTVPPVVASLPGLQALGIGNNSIAELPAFVTLLTNLEALDVRNNNLKVLMPQLCLLPLRSLLVEGNMLRTLRRSVIERGTPALLEYLKDRMPV